MALTHGRVDVLPGPSRVLVVRSFFVERLVNFAEHVRAVRPFDPFEVRRRYGFDELERLGQRAGCLLLENYVRSQCPRLAVRAAQLHCLVRRDIVVVQNRVE